MAPLNCHKPSSTSSFEPPSSISSSPSNNSGDHHETKSYSSCSKSPDSDTESGKDGDHLSYADACKSNCLLVPRVAVNNEHDSSERSPGDGCDIPNGPAEHVHPSLDVDKRRNWSSASNLESKNLIFTGSPEKEMEERTESSLPPKDLGPSSNFTHTFLKSILSSIDSKDPVVANAWLETLLDVMDLLPCEVINNEIVPVAVCKSESQHLSDRIASCKLIGKLASKFGPNQLRQEVCGAVLSLTQDVSEEVRAAVCGVFAVVASGLAQDAIRSHLMPNLLNLCCDDKVNVKIAALHSILDVVPHLDHKTRQDSVMPLLRSMCERCVSCCDVTLPVLAYLLGPLCHALQERSVFHPTDDLEDEQKVWLLSWYCQVSTIGLPLDDDRSDKLVGMDSLAVWAEALLCRQLPDAVCQLYTGRNETEARQQCAYNLPAMLLFAAPLTGTFHSPPLSTDATHKATEGRSWTMLLPAVASFVLDPSVHVRHTTAKAFHQLCVLLGSSARVLREPLLQLLRSESAEVLTALLPTLPHVLTSLQLPDLPPVVSEGELVSLVLSVEDCVAKECGGVWRRHADLLHHMASLMLCVPPDMLLPRLIPRMTDRMVTARALPCRVAAVRSLLIYLQQLTPEQQRTTAANTVSVLCGSRSCHQRMLYLTLCEMSLGLLPSLFLECFSSAMLALHCDAVANIRLRVVHLLPALKSKLTLPRDSALLQSLETAVGRLLLTESDRDVRDAVEESISALESVHVHHCPESSAVRGANDDLPTRPAVTLGEASASSPGRDLREASNGSTLSESSASTDAAPDSNSTLKSSGTHLREEPNSRKNNDRAHPDKCAGRSRNDSNGDVAGNNKRDGSEIKGQQADDGSNRKESEGDRSHHSRHSSDNHGAKRHQSGIPRAAGMPLECQDVKCGTPAVNRRLSAVLPPPTRPPDSSTVMREGTFKASHATVSNPHQSYIHCGPHGDQPVSKLRNPSQDQWYTSSPETLPCNAETTTSSGGFGIVSGSENDGRGNDGARSDGGINSSGSSGVSSSGGSSPMGSCYRDLSFNNTVVTDSSAWWSQVSGVTPFQGSGHEELYDTGSPRVSAKTQHPLPHSSSTSIDTDSVILLAQQKLQQTPIFRLPKEFVKLSSQLVGSSCLDAYSNSADVRPSVRPADRSPLNSCSDSPPVSSTQNLLANLRKSDSCNFTEEAWQKLSKLKLTDKLASYREKANNISSRELFWLRSSRTRWRRKVASADTSPEDTKRIPRFTRGLSEDSAQRYRVDGNDSSKEQENEHTTDVSHYGHRIHLLQNDENSGYSNPSSPLGMYTWPPQHFRQHRAFSSSDDSTSSPAKPGDTAMDTGAGEAMSVIPDTNSSFKLDRPPMTKGHNYYSDVQANYSSRTIDSKLSNSHQPNFSPHHKSSLDSVQIPATSDCYLKGRPEYPLPRYTKSSDGSNFGGHDRTSSFSGVVCSGYVPSLSFEQQGLTSSPWSDRRYASHDPSLGLQLNKKLACVRQDAVSDDMGLWDGKTYSSSSSSVSDVSHGRTYSRSTSISSSDERRVEDLYVVHGIPPTIGGKGSLSAHDLRSLPFPHSEKYANSMYSGKGSSGYQRASSVDDPLYCTPYSPPDRENDPIYETIAFGDSNNKLPYHSYSNNPKDYKHNSGFYDSGEFATRSSSSAYPIGPLGASWIQQGMVQYPSSPWSRLGRFSRVPVRSSSWSIKYSPSSLSLSSLDPAADEFIVDTGVRMDESSLRSRLPTPLSLASSPSRASYSRPHFSSFNSMVSNLKDLKSYSSRLRPPTPSSRMAELSSDSFTRDSADATSRLRSSARSLRPVSAAGGSSSAPGTRKKSLSHENLRLGARTISLLEMTGIPRPEGHHSSATENDFFLKTNNRMKPHSNYSSAENNQRSMPSSSSYTSPVGENSHRSSKSTTYADGQRVKPPYSSVDSNPSSKHSTRPSSSCSSPGASRSVSPVQPPYPRSSSTLGTTSGAASCVDTTEAGPDKVRTTNASLSSLKAAPPRRTNAMSKLPLPKNKHR
ncbi:Armadillo-type fold [Trinorchestia longiramus]|nr:Armadillo-type fold [Trinorchestia longiramus]